MHRPILRRVGQILLKTSVAVSFLLFVATLAFNIISQIFDLYVNASSSLPVGIYKTRYYSEGGAGFFSLPGSAQSADHIDRDTLVLACLPAATAEMAHSRGYIMSGRCPGGYAPVGKKVVAIGGDSVVFSDAGILVNGKSVPFSAPKPTDTMGRAMPVTRGRFILSDNELVLANPVSGSFDSRYFGPVKKSGIYADLTPILTFRSLSDDPK